MSGLPGPLQGLLHPRAYPHAVRSVELVETHVSWVLLTGDFAYKIKRPVHYRFVDLRSAEHRAFLCQEEVRLNRRFAPELYLRVCTITLESGEARIEGPGPIIEQAVQMRQFTRTEELTELLAKGAITPAALESFGGDLARIHAGLPVADERQSWGHPEAWRRIALDNAAECLQIAKTLGQDLSLMRQLQSDLEVALERSSLLQAQRFTAARVRECHGDLHAANVVRWRERLLAFDCLEFDPALRWTDVADDVAFLLADLDFLHQPTCAQAFLSGYLTESGDYQACRLLGLFKAHRALVRAKVTALRAIPAKSASPDVIKAKEQYCDYVECARRSLMRHSPILVLMCGLSGSGKTWVARHLAPRLGAVHLRSDIERKRVTGESPAQQANAALAKGRYSRAVTEQVYERLLTCTQDVLLGGYPTIADATFAEQEGRARFHHLADELGIKCFVVYCQAPEDVLRSRILGRLQRADDPSEANLAVLRWQQECFQRPNAKEGGTLIEVSTTDPAALEQLYGELTH